MVKGDLEDLLKRFPLQRRERLAPVPEPDEAIWAAPDPEETLEDGTHYVKEYRKKQIEEFMSYQQKLPFEETKNEVLQKACPSVCNELSRMEENSILDVSTSQTVDQDRTADVLQKYNLFTQLKTSEKDLPVSSECENIMDQIKANSVTVISGPTGCGKTTLIPLFILQDQQRRKSGARIVVTQPRRIAAQSVARRVAESLGIRLGTLVGYKVGLDRANCSSDTLLLYCTTGILKKTILSERGLTSFTHIILDEVHDRDEEMDFLLLLCKHFVNTNSRDVKVILMSATLECEKLVDYFTWRSGPLRNCGGASSHILKLNSNFDIKEFFLDDLLCSGIKVDLNNLDKEPVITKSMIETFLYILHQLGKNLVADKGAVLVFLPGEAEISRLKNEIEQMKEFKDKNWWILALHSRVPLDQMQEVFHRKPGFRKVILATNIAESSITISEVEVVVDFCLSKILFCDQQTNNLKLKSVWIDGNNAIQRRGRCGRTCNGRVYRLVSKSFFKSNIESFKHPPEIQRIPLEKAILDSKLLDFGPPKEVLALAIDPPNLKNLRSTVMLLKEIGALLMTSNGVENEDDGDLTVLGEVLATLPLEVRLGKLVVYGYLLDVFDDCVVIAAGLAGRSIFSTPFTDRLKSFTDKSEWAKSSFSDCLAVLNAYKTWKERGQNKFFRDRHSELLWCQNKSLQLKALREMDATVADIYSSLGRKQIFNQNHPNLYAELSSSEEELFVQVALFGAFYPNYVYRAGGSKDMREVYKKLEGHPLHSSVYLSGLTSRQSEHVELYEKQIKQSLCKVFNSESMEIFFEGTKIVVVFKPKPQFGSVSKWKRDATQTKTSAREIMTEVYTALKMSQLNEFSVTLKIYPDQIGIEKLSNLKKKENKIKREWIGTNPTIRSIGQARHPFDGGVDWEVEILHIETPSCFWVTSCRDKSEMKDLELSLKTAIKSHKLKFSEHINELKLEELVLVEHNGTPFRGGIISLECPVGLGLVQVRLVDVGEIVEVAVEKVCRLVGDFIFEFPKILSTPALVFECSLSHVKPRVRAGSRNCSWDFWAIEAFQEILTSKTYWPRVACILPGSNGPVAFVNLFRTSDMEDSINKEFLQLVDEEGSHFAIEEIDDQITFGLSNFIAPTNNLLEPHDINVDEASLCVQLRGPSHPLEINWLVGITVSDRAKKIRIEPDSVNSVFLDRFPTSITDQWVVSSCFSSNSSGSVLTARSTTCMPMIGGLGPILIMAFAPRIELRASAGLERYVGCITGLGPRLRDSKYSGRKIEKTTPYYSAHDIDLSFDAMIDNDDIKSINVIRHAISKCLSRPSHPMDKYGSWLPLFKRQEMPPNYTRTEELLKTRTTLRLLFKQILFKDRAAKSKEPCPYPEFWNCLPTPESLVEFKLQNAEDHILPTFSGIKVSNTPILQTE